jgi:hypothetical protein
MTPDQLEVFGSWIVARATEYRQAIAAEDQPPTNA